jgi:hypothetical protein
VSTDVWYLMRDETGDINTKYFSGVYFYDGTSKPSFTAFRFPLVVMPAGSHANVCGIAPHTSKVVAQYRKGSGRWRTLFTVKVAAGNVFTRRSSAGLRGSFRALDGPESSLIRTR